MHGHTASAALWGTASWAQSSVHVDFHRNEATGVRCKKRNILTLPVPLSLTVISRLTQQSLGQFRRLSFSIYLCAWIVNGRNKLSSVQSRLQLQLRGSLTHHGCKILSDCRWKFYSGRSTKPGFCPLFGLLQLQQGEKSFPFRAVVLFCVVRSRWDWNH